MQEENRVLREQLGAGACSSRMFSAVASQPRPRELVAKGSSGIRTLVTPNTLLRWYRRLVAKKSRRAQHIGTMTWIVPSRSTISAE